MASNRYTHNKRDGNKGFTNNAQKKYVPKTPNSTIPQSNPTLSTSLRQQQQPESSSSLQSNTAAMASGSRVRIGDKGDWVPNKVHGGNFARYLPQDEAVASGLGADDGGLDPLESQRVVDLLNGELSRLLMLRPRDFWKEVANDSSLHDFLDSFLQFRSRWYDFPLHGAKGIVAGVIVGEFELSRRVFMVLYRISSNRDPGAKSSDSLSFKDHEVLLKEKKLLDLPKLLDICALYAHENEDLTRELVVNAIKVQPWVHKNLSAAVSHYLSIGHTMYERCTSSLEVLFSVGVSSDHNFSRLQSDYLEVVDFMNDAIVSMDAFVCAYNPAAVFFSSPVNMSDGNEDLIITLVKLHDSLIPSLQRGFRIICMEDKNTLSKILISLKMLSIRIVNFGWKLLELCYCSNEVFESSVPLPESTKIFPAAVEDSSIRADILLQTFREINCVSSAMNSYNNKGTFLQHAEKTFGIIQRLESLQSNGWISMEFEQWQYLSGILLHSSQPIVKGLPNASISTTTKTQMNDEDAIMESKISQIKDLFPEYGKGFLSACLEVYNHNPEEVIQRILESTLHEDLKSLDTSLENIPPPKPASSISRNDKGKGKLLPTSVPPPNPVPSSSSSSSSTTGRFVRKSKIDEPIMNSMTSEAEKDLVKKSALISLYEYEDEYDDSFDDLGLSVGDLGLDENETLNDRMNPNSGKSSRTENETSTQNPSNAKWNSAKKPQFFVKDGKNYSYKVQGSIAVANSGEASLINEAQKEMIHGLGRGGNIPLGAVKRFSETHKEPEEQFDGGNEEMGGRGGNMGNPRGRGRRGGGGRNNTYRKDQAMKKHFGGLRGF